MPSQHTPAACDQEEEWMSKVEASGSRADAAAGGGEGGGESGDRPAEPSSTQPSRRGPYRKTAGRQQEILDAALAVFGRAGYRSGSIREIAEAVGISQPGLLHHFESKNALLTAVLRHRDEQSRAFYSLPLGIGTLVSTVKVVEFNVARPGIVELYCVLSAEATAEDHPAHDYFTERYSYLRGVIGQALENMREAGQLAPGVKPAVTARGSLALMDGLQVQWLLNPESVDMVADTEAYFRQLTVGDAWSVAMSDYTRDAQASGAPASQAQSISVETK
jgi:AcrR family transcriptional regulator